MERSQHRNENSSSSSARMKNQSREEYKASDLTRQPEGKIAKSIEGQTAKIPSDVFLWAAVSSIAGSAVLQAIGKKHTSLFVGQWVPTLLMFGLYNKLVKVAGSDRTERDNALVH